MGQFLERGPETDRMRASSQRVKKFIRLNKPDPLVQVVTVGNLLPQG